MKLISMHVLCCLFSMHIALNMKLISMHVLCCLFSMHIALNMKLISMHVLGPALTSWSSVIGQHRTIKMAQLASKSTWKRSINVISVETHAEKMGVEFGTINLLIYLKS